MTIVELEERIGRKLEYRAGKGGCGKFKNEIFVGETIAFVVLYKRGTPTSVAVIDSDIARFAQYHTWHQTIHGYVGMGSKGECVYLHRYVMGTHPTLNYIDHINGDKLDNRRENLRFVTQQLNMRNRPGILGYSYMPEKPNPWRAYLSISGKQKHLGYYKTKEEAIEARKRGEKLYFGEVRPEVRPPLKEDLI